MTSERKSDVEARRLLSRVGIIPRERAKTPDWIGSFKGPADLSEHLDAYKHAASEAAEADAFGISLEDLRAKRRREERKDR
jgi:hypothetical protein